MSKQEIYNRLRAGGLTRAGALAMMGNWECESNLEAGRLQGDFSPFRTTSKDYVVRASTGRMDKTEFCRAVGFGLAQWTLPYRKGKLWEFWKASARELDDPIMQTDFALRELTTEGEYAGLYRLLCSSDDLYNNTASICRLYERPAINNIDARYAEAMQLEQSISDGQQEEPPEAQETEPPETNGVQVMPEHEYWPPRVLCSGIKGTDVEVMTALLKAKGAGIHYVTAEFGQFVEQKLKAYQTTAGLKADGICGPLTWGELLKR